MLSHFNAIDIEEILRKTAVTPPFPPATDRVAWDSIRARLGAEPTTALISQANDDARCPIPVLPATFYLDFSRTGGRGSYETPMSRRREMLARFVLAECLEGKARFLDPILDTAWAICEESSWAYPAHQHSLTDIKRPYIDLGAAMTALGLAEVDALVGSELDPALSKRIHDEVEQRCIAPYLTRHDHWWLYNTQQRTINNWTAVCNAGVAGAALYLEPDPARLAEVIARAARSLDDYLATFDPDGGSSEGPGYWSYGFGYYTILAQLVAHRTGGAIDFLAGDHVCRIAQFPLRTVLSPGRYVNFSDCDPDVQFIPAHLAYLARRLGLSDLLRLADNQGPLDIFHRSGLTWPLRSLVWYPAPEAHGVCTPTRQDWLSGMTWMIARRDPSDPNALVLAVKGGHNDEMHNQNDVGNFIVHIGRMSVIADVGRGRYTRFYFGSERYEHFVNSSRGHSVPVVNGQLQAPGRVYAATLIEHRADDTLDRLILELKGAYPAEADLSSLRRSLTLHRDTPRGWVELVDTAQFASYPGHLESVLTTFGPVNVEPSAVEIREGDAALRVHFESATVTARVEVEKQVDLSSGPRDINRVIFAFARPVQTGIIRLRIEPI